MLLTSVFLVYFDTFFVTSRLLEILQETQIIGSDTDQKAHGHFQL
jgi:hypothetical protein